LVIEIGDATETEVGGEDGAAESVSGLSGACEVRGRGEGTGGVDVCDHDGGLAGGCVVDTELACEIGTECPDRPI